MKIEKCFVVAAPHEEVWAFITTPERVAPCLPGCDEVEAVGDNKYKANIKVQVGPIKTAFKVDVEATEERAPEFAAYSTRGEEGGRASRISATSTLALKPLDTGRTEVTYTSEVSIVGRLGKFGAGMMKKKADAMGDEFVTALRAELEEPGLEQEAVPAETAAAAPAGWWARLLAWFQRITDRKNTAKI